MAAEIQPSIDAESILVRFTLPRWIVAAAKLDESALDEAALEALAIDLFRCGRLSRPALGRMLGLDRVETGTFLKRHRCFDDPSHEEIDAEVEATAHRARYSGIDKRRRHQE